jgi:hypothetical protein
MKVTLQGDESFQAEILTDLRAAKIDIDLTTSKGSDGQQLLSFIYDNGPQILLLLNTIAQIVKSRLDKKKRTKITIETE